MGTWHASRTIQECREACGGAGYLSVNRFDALRADTDVFTTFEGDNHILLQLVAKGLLTDYADEIKGIAAKVVAERGRVRTELERRLSGESPPEVTLVADGMLEQNSDTGKYRLGMALFRLGSLVRRRRKSSARLRTIIPWVRLLDRVFLPLAGWPHGDTGWRLPRVRPPSGWSTGSESRVIHNTKVLFAIGIVDNRPAWRLFSFFVPIVKPRVARPTCSAYILPSFDPT